MYEEKSQGGRDGSNIRISETPFIPAKGREWGTLFSVHFSFSVHLNSFPTTLLYLKYRFQTTLNIAHNLRLSQSILEVRILKNLKLQRLPNPLPTVILLQMFKLE
jgi:hypothetical protein